MLSLRVQDTNLDGRVDARGVDTSGDGNVDAVDYDMNGTIDRHIPGGGGKVHVSCD